MNSAAEQRDGGQGGAVGGRFLQLSLPVMLRACPGTWFAPGIGRCAEPRPWLWGVRLHLQGALPATDPPPPEHAGQIGFCLLP